MATFSDLNPEAKEFLVLNHVMSHLCVKIIAEYHNRSIEDTVKAMETLAEEELAKGCIAGVDELMSVMDELVCKS